MAALCQNNSKSNKLHHQIFWYKAEQRADFKLGSKEFWELSKGLDSDDEDVEPWDPNSSRKSKGPQISVRKSKSKW